MKTIHVSEEKKRLLDMEKIFSGKPTIESVLDDHIDFDSIEKKFKRLGRV